MTRRLALVLAMMPVSAWAQGTFDGTLNGTMTASGTVIPFRYAQLGSHIRTEYTMEGNSVVTIFDATTGNMLYIIPQQKKYLVSNLRESGGIARQMARAMMGRGAGGDVPDFSKMKVTPTGQRETIAGVSCEHYLFEYADSAKAKNKVDMCGAPGMGFMGLAGQEGSMMPSTVAMMRSQNPALAKLAHQGFFPLKMNIMGEHGTAVWTVTQLNRGRPDATLFQPPAGYTELKIPTGHD
ncbi:MAG: hypothetical protein DMD62_04655 [Gemmatimonadetes bacterium]|nr:MAG: hypothetical protein DMD62_04655 [Gemmatimonadota bacterium]